MISFTTCLTLSTNAWLPLLLERDEGRGRASRQIKIDVKRSTKHNILQLAIGINQCLSSYISKQAKMVRRLHMVDGSIYIEEQKLSSCASIDTCSK
jgi:hypothetical protein